MSEALSTITCTGQFVQCFIMKLVPCVQQMLVCPASLRKLHARGKMVSGDSKKHQQKQGGGRRLASVFPINIIMHILYAMPTVQIQIAQKLKLH